MNAIALGSNWSVAPMVVTDCRSMLAESGLTLQAAIQQCIAAKAAAGRRSIYVRELRRSLLKFSEGRESMGIASVSPEAVEAYLKDNQYSMRTRETQMTRLGSLFSWAERRGYIQFNPVRRLERIVIDHPPPRILTPAEAERLVLLAEARQPKLFGYVVLGLYVGIRPDELARLTWADVDVDRGLVRIDSAAAKTRKRRIVPLEAKAVYWLRRVPRRQGPIADCNRPHQLQRLAKWMGWERWIHDVLRHTCASQLLALHGDAGRVSRILGNSPAILLSRYLELVDPNDCKLFWSVQSHLEPMPPVTKECSHCGAAFTPRRWTQFCSRQCRHGHYRSNNRDKRLAYAAMWRARKTER
jgi:integrase